MRSRSSRTSSLAPVALLAAVAIASLAGCSSTGTATSDTPSASASSAKTESLPSDFPKSDVPLVDGDILVARGDAGNGWSVTVQPKDENGFADAKTALEGAGYTLQPGATDTKAVYMNDKYTVAVGTPGVSVTYTVTAN